MNKNIRIIANFLRSKNVLEKFCYNTMVYQGYKVKPHSKLRERTIDIISKSWEKMQIAHPHWGEDYRMSEFIVSIDSAFFWEATPEGKDFWQKINTKWYYHLIKIKSQAGN